MFAARNRSVLDLPTLVLSRNWVPVRMVSARQAIGLVAGGAASIVDPVTFEVHDLNSWDAVSRARDRFEGARIRSPRLSLARPEVILLRRYAGRGSRTVTFSRANLYRRDRFRCQYCGARPALKDLTIDHVVPRSRGGGSTWENCVVACLPCNGRKSDRLPAEAGMRLRSEPRRPPPSRTIGFPRDGGCESWKHFLDRAYWEVELEP